MTLTKVVGGVIADTTITSTDILDSTITNAKLAVDPANASNLSSGDVPLAQLGNVPDPDLTAQKGDIALLAFKTQANGNLARYNLVDQFVDAFEDATGISASDSTNEVRSTSNYFSGSATPDGGTVTTYGAYTVHSFTSTGNTNFVVGAAGNVDALVIAGAGGGGGSRGGGGGAGGFRTATTHAVTAQTYVITVGSGGIGGSWGPPSTVGTKGGNSVFSTITSTGGGGGGSTAVKPGETGGSGGGGAAPAGGPGGAGNEGGFTPVEGYAGGGGSTADPSAPNYGAGGGGGSSAVGTTGIHTPAPTLAAGGAGTANSLRTNSSVTYAAGGIGGCDHNATGSDGIAGGANTGDGGGGGRNYGSGATQFDGGDGGSGLVVIRYSTGDLEAYLNMTLVSNTTTTATAPTKGDLVFTYTNGAGTAVVGTNITAEYSADAGSTWTDFGIAAGDVQGTTGGHTIVTKNNVSLTSTSGTNMRYRIKTLVQSASLQTRIQAVSLGWS